MKNIFDQKVSNQIVERITSLTTTTKANWGKMDVAQMLAHCNVTYNMDADNQNYPKAKGLKRFMLKLFVKNTVVGEKPYPKNSRTAPEFIVQGAKDFEKEKTELINNINETCKKGENFYEGRESNSFGKLTKKEYSNMFYKHLDHHLSQFGV